MRRRGPLSMVVACAAAAAALAAVLASPGRMPSAPAGIAPAFASASAPAAASAKPPQRDPDPRPLAEGFPSDPSAQPGADEWKSAPLVTLPRRSPRSQACRVYRVREWIKVHCDGTISAVRQLAGNPAEVTMWVAPITNQTLFSAAQSGGQVLFPLRRDDRRIFQFFALNGGEYGGAWSEAGVVVEARWLDGEPGPKVTLR